MRALFIYSTNIFSFNLQNWNIFAEKWAMIINLKYFVMTSYQDDADRKAAIHTRGCFKAVTSILHDNVVVVGGVIIGILVPQVYKR